MAQPISPENWVNGIDSDVDDIKPVGDILTKIFTGSGSPVSFASTNKRGITEACRVWNLVGNDYITTPDPRRVNGYNPANPQGSDGWGGSTYGVFQDVRFDSRVYTCGRRRSTAFRIWEDELYSGPMGYWGDAETSAIMTNGQNLLSATEAVNKALQRWKEQILAADIIKYSIASILQGRISGLWVDADPNVIFNGEGTWVAQPGTIEGAAIPPRFAPIHAVEWNDDNLPLLLNHVEVTWSNMLTDTSSKVCILDPYYKIKLIQALAGQGITVTESAFSMIKTGEFTEMMGWKFNFEIPSQFWPQLWLDDNYNVVHSADGLAPWDAWINSVPGRDGYLKLQDQLIQADRMIRPNYIRTDWDAASGTFVKSLTNYPLGQPGAVPYLGLGESAEYDWFDASNNTDPQNPASHADGHPKYPWSGPGSGYGLPHPTGPVGEPTRRQVVGLFCIPDAAELKQIFDFAYTDTDPIRGAFIEAVTEVRFDAYVIEGRSHKILPIVDAKANIGQFSIPVTEIPAPVTDPTVDLIAVAPTALALGVNEKGSVTVQISGEGPFDTGWRATSSAPGIAIVNGEGVVTGLAVGVATITFVSIEDPSKTATLTVTVS